MSHSGTELFYRIYLIHWRYIFVCRTLNKLPKRLLRLKVRVDSSKFARLAATNRALPP